jgi:hypothetical protein
MCRCDFGDVLLPPERISGAGSGQNLCRHEESGGGAVIVSVTVQPNGLLTTCHVEYGPGVVYGQRGHDMSVATDSAVAHVRDTLVNLQPGTIYHYRLVATSSAGVARDVHIIH